MAKNNDNVAGGLTAVGMLLRFVFALVLVLLTYNPSGKSAYHWISTAVAESSFGPMHLILVALSAVLAIGVSWSHVWRRVTGQINVEDVDD